jgi:hypothetical protein
MFTFATQKMELKNLVILHPGVFFAKEQQTDE